MSIAHWIGSGWWRGSRHIGRREKFDRERRSEGEFRKRNENEGEAKKVRERERCQDRG
jgi:hypothetical protein